MAILTPRDGSVFIVPIARVLTVTDTPFALTWSGGYVMERRIPLIWNYTI
jgi:hypothetical protein